MDEHARSRVWSFAVWLVGALMVLVLAWGVLTVHLGLILLAGLLAALLTAIASAAGFDIKAATRRRRLGNDGWFWFGGSG